MSVTELQEFYSRRKSEFTDQLKAISKRINVISNFRLAAAFAFIVILYFGFSNHALLYTLPVLLVVFLFLVKKHAALFDHKTQLENLIHVHELEMRALDGDFSGFDNGAEFIDTHHAYAHDLDIFGEGSVYQFVNRANTLNGKRNVSQRLTHPLLSIEAIRDQQNAIQELSSLHEFRHAFQAAGMSIKEQPEDYQQLLSWISQPSFIYGKFSYRVILTVFPLITLTLLVLAFFIDGVAPFVWLCAALQWAFLGFHMKKVNAFHQYISRKKIILERYANMLHYMRQEKFQSAILSKLSTRANQADLKVRSLASLVSAFDARMNAMTTLFTNSLLLYDLQCVYRLERWKEENAAELRAWLDSISEMEVLNSFATFSFNNSSFIFPSINKEGRLSAEALGHPLIPADECVANDVSLEENSVMIITGANMAGKSTFLRTLGVNVVLALAGAPVNAREFNCPLIHLRSGMRTADSLRDHQSYFYAELDRLKSIMDELRQGRPLLILLDEILKGTNSTDKLAGSLALIKQLVKQPCLVIVATHDLALGTLENEFPERVRNFCFEANIENDQLSFDYKLKPGLAQKMNATFLMKKMGIIPVQS